MTTKTTMAKAMKAKIQGRTIRAVLYASLLVAGTLFAQAPAAAADEAGPAAALAPTPIPTLAPAVASGSIERLNAGLLSAMKGGKELGFEGRRKALEPEIDAAFDLPGMAKAILGREASKLTPEQGGALASSFRRFTVANYAAEFDGWGGERFEIGVEIGENQNAHQ